MDEYKIEDCSLYRESRSISGIPVYIFEDHNMALPAWGTVCSRIGESINLITFDSHTDTHPGFNSYIIDMTGEAPNYGEYGLKNPIIREVLNGSRFLIDDFSFEAVFRVATGYLKNTEQILCGVDLDYLSSYTVVNREDGVGTGYERDDRMMGYKATYTSRETWDLWDEKKVEDPIILDFDLDFFGKETDFDDDFTRKVSPLVKRAKAITIAREPKFFEYCKQDERYTNDKALEQLLSLIKESLSERE